MLKNIWEAFKATEDLTKAILIVLSFTILFLILWFIWLAPKAILMLALAVIIGIIAFALIIGAALFTLFAICDWRDQYYRIKNKI